MFCDPNLKSPADVHQDEEEDSGTGRQTSRRDRSVILLTSMDKEIPESDPHFPPLGHQNARPAQMHAHSGWLPVLEPQCIHLHEMLAHLWLLSASFFSCCCLNSQQVLIHHHHQHAVGISRCYPRTKWCKHIMTGSLSRGLFVCCWQIEPASYSK
jgi:hypothetical protein